MAHLIFTRVCARRSLSIPPLSRIVSSLSDTDVLTAMYWVESVDERAEHEDEDEADVDTHTDTQKGVRTRTRTQDKRSTSAAAETETRNRPMRETHSDHKCKFGGKERKRDGKGRILRLRTKPAADSVPTVKYSTPVHRPFQDLVTAEVASEHPKLEAFFAWLTKHGFEDYGKFRLSRSVFAGYGAVAAAPVSADEELFSVPAKLSIFAASPFASPVTRSALARVRSALALNDTIMSTSDLIQLSVLILLEKRQADSIWAPSIALISEPVCPAFYSMSEAEELQNPWLQSIRSKMLEELYAIFVSLLADAEFAAIVLSLYPPLSSPLYRVRAVASLDLPPEEVRLLALKGEFLWALTAVMQRSFRWRDGERVMVPLLELFNHKPGVPTNYYYTTLPNRPFVLRMADARNGDELSFPLDKKAILFASSRNLTAGEEIFISYHTELNSVTSLMQYGFVSPANPLDFIQLHLIMPTHEHEEITALRNRLWARVTGRPPSDSPLFANVGRDGLLDSTFLAAAAVGVMDPLEAKRLAETDAEPMPMRWQRFSPALRVYTCRALHVILGQCLSAFPTSLADDLELLRTARVHPSLPRGATRRPDPHSGLSLSRNAHTALLFRIEVKKLIELTQQQLDLASDLILNDLPLPEPMLLETQLRSARAATQSSGDQRRPAFPLIALEAHIDWVFPHNDSLSDTDPLSRSPARPRPTPLGNASSPPPSPPFSSLSSSPLLQVVAVPLEA